MDIFKLIFEHDLLLESLSGNEDPKNEKSRPSTLEEFLKPAQTYSRFYLSGTQLEGPDFGISCLTHYNDILSRLDEALNFTSFTTNENKLYVKFSAAASDIDIGDVIVCHNKPVDTDLSAISIKDQSGVRARMNIIIDLLNDGHVVVFKEKSVDGFDFHIFSRANLYENLFYPLKSLISENFRLFSINGKRAKNERVFYFETYRLNDPPHGFMEVEPETII